MGESRKRLWNVLLAALLGAGMVGAQGEQNNRGLSPIILIVAGLVCVSLTACASGGAHENFMNTMQSYVGQNLDDPYLYINRNRNLYVSTRPLANGNVEEEFKGGRRLKCKIFFEVYNKAAKIVGWRYEGSDEDCAIIP